MTDVDFTEVWRQTLSHLEADGVPSQARALLQLSRLVGILDHTALLSVPNDYTKDYIELRSREVVAAALGVRMGRAIRIAVSVDPALESHPPLTPLGSVAVPDVARPDLVGSAPEGLASGRAVGHDEVEDSGPARRRQRDTPMDAEKTRLNPKYTFDTFVIGASNRFAHAA
ncbi:MAG TPA: DnaA/Hda family protein, partial [Candidatus Lustribacter sp.]|nr:DnaA/Hda family protein [Candidatus Lustribacter sp.]